MLLVQNIAHGEMSVSGVRDRRGAECTLILWLHAYKQDY